MVLGLSPAEHHSVALGAGREMIAVERSRVWALEIQMIQGLVKRSAAQRSIQLPSARHPAMVAMESLLWP